VVAELVEPVELDAAVEELEERRQGILVLYPLLSF